MASMRHSPDLATQALAMLQQLGGGGYPGGKGQEGLWQFLCSLMPTHSCYVEPFAGRGGLHRRKAPALASLLIDLDADVIDWWRRLDWPATIVMQGDGIRWTAAHGPRLDADTLIYLDPPYLPATRVKTRLYRYELSDRDHRRLLRAATAASCPVMLSAYPSALYDRALSGWRRFTREVMTRGRRWRTEAVYCNFDPARATPAAAMRYAALGKDFRERERVARRVKTWTSRFRAMSADERRAILLALHHVNAAAIAGGIGGDIGIAGCGDKRSPKGGR